MTVSQPGPAAQTQPQSHPIPQVFIWGFLVVTNTESDTIGDELLRATGDGEICHVGQLL